MKVSGEFPVSPEGQIELTGQNGIGLEMMNSYSCSEDDIHSPKLVPEKELKPVYGTPNQEEVEVLLKSRSKKSKENTPAPSVLKQLLTCKKGSIPRCLSKKCKNEMEGSQNFCNKTDCIEQYADYAVDKLKKRRKKLKEACYAVLFNKYTRTVLFWNEFPSKSSLLQFLTEHRDFEMCFPRDDKQICGVKKMIERLEKEGKMWQAQVEQIPDSSDTDTKLPIQRTNSSASIDTLNLFGDGSTDDRSELRTNSDSHEAHDDKISSGSPASKKIEADAEYRVKSVSMENREFDNKTNCECEVNEGVKVTAQMQEDTEDDTCSQTSLDSDSGYFGSSVDGSSYLGSSVDGPDYFRSAVDIHVEPHGSAVDSKPIDSSCFKSMDSTCFISENSKSHGSLDPILSRLSRRDTVEQLPEHWATSETKGKVLNADEIVELSCPEEEKPLVEVSSGSAHVEHSPNRYTSASPQLKQCNLDPKGEVLLYVSDKQDGFAEQMNLTTTEMIKTKEYVSAEIDCKTFFSNERGALHGQFVHKGQYMLP